MTASTIIFTAVIAFLGAIVYTLWDMVQSLGSEMWQYTSDLKQKVSRLEDEIVDLNKTIKVLKESSDQDEMAND